MHRVSTMVDQQLNSVTSGAKEGSITVMTFYIEDSLYAIPIENVVSLSKEIGNLQELPIKAPGLLGLSHFQDSIVPVVDIAKRIGVKAGTEAKSELIQTLTAREQDHIDWLDALEDSIHTGDSFVKARDPHQCAFGKWYDKFDTRNEALKEVMSQFDQPHKEIHSLADKLLGMSNRGDKDEALKELAFQRLTTLRRLRSLFSHAREQLTEMMRPILLYVSCDGRTPDYALLIDEVHDALTYQREDCHSPSQAGFQALAGQDVYIKYILSDKNQPNSIMFDVDNILAKDHLASIEESAA